MVSPNTDIVSAIFKRNQIGTPDFKLYPREHGETVYGQFIPYTAGLAVWLDLRNEFEQLHYYPILAVNDVRFQLKSYKTYDVAKCIAEAQNVEPDDWFAGRWNTLRKDELEKNTRGPLPELRKPGPLTNAHKFFYCPSDYEETGLFLALLPIEEPWMVAAFLRLGGWNYCPHPKYQTCVHKYWLENNGANFVFDGNEHMEFIVANPPETAEAALKLAEEQFLFCHDLVKNSTRTIENLAASLYKSPFWFFKWA